MSRKRRNHSPEFKAKVGLAAIKGDRTVSELSSQYGIHANQIQKWKKLVLERCFEVFTSGSSISTDRGSETQALQAKIGQLTMENDFLSKALDR